MGEKILFLERGEDAKKDSGQLPVPRGGTGPTNFIVKTKTTTGTFCWSTEGNRHVVIWPPSRGTGGHERSEKKNCETDLYH